MTFSKPAAWIFAGSLAGVPAAIAGSAQARDNCPRLPSASLVIVIPEGGCDQAEPAVLPASGVTVIRGTPPTAKLDRSATGSIAPQTVVIVIRGGKLSGTSRRMAMFLGEARTPPGTRLYAIGDIHGCDALLARVHTAIADDLRQRPPADHRIIHVGDYVDRGPDSAAVVARLIGLTERDARVVCLGGNHEELLLTFLDEPLEVADLFFRFGGLETMRSYGVTAEEPSSDAEAVQLRDRFAAALPDRHRTFLAGLADRVQFGDFVFCHAGIAPGVPLEEQTAGELRWIREPFLKDPRDHGFIVIHGHTPADAPEIRPNRINIDTGAVFGGRLTCLALEGTALRFL